MPEVFGLDAHAPKEIAARELEVGVAKPRLPWLTQALLGVLPGVKCLLLPLRNKKDLRDISEPTRSAIEFVWLEQVDDALRAALTGAAASRSLAFG